MIAVDGLAWLVDRALPGTRCHTLQLIPRHVPKNFVIDPGHESSGASELFGALESFFGNASFKLHRGVGEVEIPETGDGEIEHDGDHAGDGHVHGGGKPDGGGQKDIDRVLAVIEGVAETHRRHDTGQTEGERETVLHEHHDARDHQGQHDQ